MADLDNETEQKRGNTPAHGSPAPLDPRVVKAGERLLWQFLNQAVRLILNKEVPIQIKLILTPLLFMAPVFMVAIIVLGADCAMYMWGGKKQVNFDSYLNFFEFMVVVAFATSILYARVSGPFQSTRELDDQLNRVTKARLPRRKGRQKK